MDDTHLSLCAARKEKGCLSQYGPISLDLGGACKDAARAASLNVIACEVVLDIASAVYTPYVSQHIPGVANCVADFLSRLEEPNSPIASIPPFLERTTRTIPARDGAWWRSTHHPR